VIAAIVADIVDFARRRAVLVVIVALALAVAAGILAANRLAIDTSIDRMLPSDVAWRQNENALDLAFPQNDDLLVVVIDGQTPDLADRAARELTDRMRAEPALFTYVRQPDGGPFFEQNGLLFLPTEEVEKVTQQLISAQPLLGSLTHDPSLRGLFEALALFVSQSAKEGAAIERLDATLAAIGDVVQGVLDGKPQSLSWQQMMTGEKPEPRELRRFVLTRPVLDFTGLEPGGKARAEIAPDGSGPHDGDAHVELPANGSIGETGARSARALRLGGIADSKYSVANFARSRNGLPGMTFIPRRHADATSR